MKVKRNIELKCNYDNIRESLTKGKHYAKYLFGAEVKSNWQEGGSIDFYIEQEGKRIKIIQGVIDTIEVNKRLRYSLFPLNADYENVPKNHIYVEYRIVAKEDEKCELTISRNDFENSAEDNTRCEYAQPGWEHTLPLLEHTIRSIHQQNS